MGQAASRQAAKQAQKVVGNSAKSSAQAAAAAAQPPRPPPLGRPVADAPEVIEDAESIVKERQLKETLELLRPDAGGPPSQAPPKPAPPAMPQPDLNSGFFRGQISDPRDVAQEQFLAHQSGAPQQQQTPELAPDLIKFLQDLGPLEKKVNKEMTSRRIVEELEKGKESEEAEIMQQLDAEAAHRNRDDMRLVESIDGFSTPRTTNFFSTAAIEDEEPDFGLNDLEIYDLLKRNIGEKDPSLCSTFHREKLQGDENETPWTEEEKQQQQQLMKDTMKYLALPIIVKDDDMSFVGVYQKELDKNEFAHQKIDIVDESRVKLVLADLHDLGKKGINRIR